MCSLLQPSHIEPTFGANSNSAGGQTMKWPWLVGGLLTGAVVVIQLFGAPTMSAHADSNTLVLTETQNGKTVHLPIRGQLVVRLPAQLGTGFSWAVVSRKGDALRLTQQRTESAGQLRPGGSEEQVFVFAPQARGSEEVELAYRRPWEKDQPPARIFRFSATVAGTP
jgi:inhibitor of cysteine peptidase